MPSLINIHTSRIYPVDLVVENDRIVSVDEISGDVTGPYILPGFVDAHIHVESSMLVPSEFARVAVVHGTVATVSDPHEIANVLGLEGVRYMIEDGERVPFTFAFGAPSCVPATPFESAGAVLGPKEVEELLRDRFVPDVHDLSKRLRRLTRVARSILRPRLFLSRTRDRRKQ